MTDSQLMGGLEEKLSKKSPTAGRRKHRTKSLEDMTESPPAKYSPTFFRNDAVKALINGKPSKTRHERELGEQLASIWEHCSSALGNTLGGYGDGRTFTCMAQMEDDQYVGALGPRLLPNGVSEFTLTIQRSGDNNGTSMLLGVAEDKSGHSVTSGKFKGRVWGLAPWNGRLLGFPDPCKRAADRKGEIRGEPLLIGNSDFRGRATGSVVRVRVDMEEKRLYLKCAYGAKQLAEAEWSLARDGDQKPIELPMSGVRPFARVAKKGDTIFISDMGYVPPVDPNASPAPLMRPPKGGRDRTLQNAGKASGSDSSAAPSRRTSKEMPSSARGDGPPLAEAREQELLAVIEKLRTEVDSLKLSLGRERLLRQQAEHEVGRVNRGLDAIVPNRRGNVPAGGSSSNSSSNANSRRQSKEL